MILYRAVHIVNGWKIPPDNSGHPNYLFWVPLFLRVILLGVHDIANHFFPRGTLHTWALWFLGWRKCMFFRILGKRRNFSVRRLPINCTLCQSTFMVLLLATYTTKKCNAQLAITSTAQTLLDRHHLLVPLLEQQWRFWENESKNGSTCYFFLFLHT